MGMNPSQLDGEARESAGSSLLAIVTDDPIGPEPLREIRPKGEQGDIDLRIVVPAVEANAFQHLLGDVDEPKREAEARLGRVLEELRASGIQADGEVGDPDPIQAVKDSLLKRPTDEVLIFEHEPEQARWFEENLREKAEADFGPPLRLVILHSDGDGQEHVVGIETPSETRPAAKDHEIGAAYLPGLSRGDLASMVAGVLGTIIVAVLAAVVTVDNGQATGRAAAAILIAIGIALVNMAHVVGLTLMESVSYRGGFARFFRYLSLVGTPLAIIAILVLLAI
jgi:drug/metabolite transporter superfamily protein YnfA